MGEDRGEQRAHLPGVDPLLAELLEVDAEPEVVLDLDEEVGQPDRAAAGVDPAVELGEAVQQHGTRSRAHQPPRCAVFGCRPRHLPSPTAAPRPKRGRACPRPSIGGGQQVPAEHPGRPFPVRPAKRARKHPAATVADRRPPPHRGPSATSNRRTVRARQPRRRRPRRTPPRGAALKSAHRRATPTPAGHVVSRSSPEIAGRRGRRPAARRQAARLARQRGRPCRLPPARCPRMGQGLARGRLLPAVPGSGSAHRPKDSAGPRPGRTRTAPARPGLPPRPRRSPPAPGAPPGPPARRQPPRPGSARGPGSRRRSPRPASGPPRRGAPAARSSGRPARGPRRRKARIMTSWS